MFKGHVPCPRRRTHTVSEAYSAGKAVWGLHLLVPQLPAQGKVGEVVQVSTTLSGGTSWLQLPLEKLDWKPPMQVTVL